MTTAIYFDLDGTLLRFDCAYADLLAEVFESELGGSSSTLVDAYNEAFFAAFESLDPNPVRAGMDAVVAATDREADPEALVAALEAAEHAHSTVPEGTRESLAALGESNRLGVLTNGVPEWQRGKLAHHDLLEQFETVVASYDVGAHKPDAAVFEAATDRLDAEQYVMVGDDYDADVVGARDAGFVPVHVEDSEGTAEFWATLRAMV